MVVLFASVSAVVTGTTRKEPSSEATGAPTRGMAHSASGVSRFAMAVDQSKGEGTSPSPRGSPRGAAGRGPNSQGDRPAAGAESSPPPPLRVGYSPLGGREYISQPNRPARSWAERIP